MTQVEQVVPEHIYQDMLLCIDRESSWCFTDIRIDRTGYGFLAVTIDDNFREEDESAWDIAEPKAIGEAFAFDAQGNLLCLREWRSLSKERAIAGAIAKAGSKLAREILATKPDRFAGGVESGTVFLDEGDFETAFTPTRNRLCKNAPFDGRMFETFGEELRQVRAVAEKSPGRVWTIVDSGEEMTIVSGMRFVNRLGYILTRHPKTDGLDFHVSLG